MNKEQVNLLGKSPSCIICFQDTQKHVPMNPVIVKVDQRCIIWKCPACGREKAEADAKATEVLLAKKKSFSDIKIQGE